MRHRAPRPLLDLLSRLRLAAPAALGALARGGPLRALVAVLMVLGLGTVALAVGPALVGDEPDPTTAGTTGVDERSEPPVSRDGGRATPEPAGAGRTPRTPTEEPSASPSTSASDATTEVAEQRESATPGVRATLPSPGTPTESPTGTASAGTESEDLTPPETSLSVRYPAGDAAEFTFGADEGATFTCSLDGAAYTSCGSPQLHSGLTPGWHTFAVRATDSAGNVDPSPAQERWLATKGRSGADPK